MAGKPGVDRPFFPKGYIQPKKMKDYVPWSYAQERLEKARAYWIGTAAPDGQPYIAPVWGIWLDDKLYFDGSPETRRGRNIEVNPKVVVHLDANENGEDVLIIQGEAHQIAGPARDLAESLSKAYTEKYAYSNYSPSPDSWNQGGLYVVNPEVVIAWTSFIKDPTRWKFKTSGFS